MFFHQAFLLLQCGEREKSLLAVAKKLFIWF